MSDDEETTNNAKESIIKYVENFIEKRNNDLRATTGETSTTRTVDKDSIVIKSSSPGDPRRETLLNRDSSSTDIDADELNLDSDPLVETLPGDEKVYRQPVYLRQYQPPTPEPVDIQVQEVIIKPPVQRPPIHVYVGPNQNRDEQRTPSPILIKSAPPQPPTANEPIVYNKYVPVDYKAQPQQIIIHRYPELPPKPRPIVVEQWLPNKPPPKRVTYRHVNRDEFVRNEIERQRNRYIEYTKPNTTIEVEIIRLPTIKLSPAEYENRSIELTRLDGIRSISQDPETLQWRI